MKTYNGKIIPFLILALCSSWALSCNKLRYDMAPKQEIKLPSQGVGALGDLEFNPTPDVMSAFFWPSKEYFKRGQELDLFDESVDYLSYLQQVANDVFLASDEWDEWTLLYLQRKGEGDKKLEEIEGKKAPILAQIRELNQENRDLKKRKRALEKQIQDASEEEKSSYESELTTVESRMAEVFEQKKELQRELAPLKGQAEALREGMLEANAYQMEKVGVVQQTLDPQAVSFVYDENGNKMTNEYGFPLRNVNEEAQVNWIKVYESSAGQDNYFDLNPEKPVIRLGSWAGQAYETKYQQNDREEWELNPDSTIYDVSLSSDEILRFKFRERDSRGNETGRVFEFEIQATPFAQYHLRLIGDIFVLEGGEVVRRGQVKAILFGKR